MFPTWFLLFLKKLVCKKIFVALLLFLPITACAGRIFYSNISTIIKVGIVWNEKDKLADTAGNDLLNYQENIQFLRYENKEQLKNAVYAKEIQWGYVFTENFDEKLFNGDIKNSIECFKTPSSFFSKITDEIVFSAVMKEYAKEVLIEYTEKSNLFSADVTKKAKNVLSQKYDAYLNGKDTFSFSYHSLNTGTNEKTENFTAAPIRGICAVLLLFAGLYGGILSIEYEKKGIYKRLSPLDKQKAVIICIFSAVSTVFLSSILSFFIAGSFRGVFYEVLLLFSYVFSIIGFSFFLAAIFKAESVLSGVIPIFMIVCILFCPVFFDITLFAPKLGFIRYLLLPFYYLKGNVLSLLLLGMLFYFCGYYLLGRRWKD